MINQYFLIMFVSVLIASFSQVLLKKSALKKYENFWQEYVNVYVISGYALLFVSMFLTVIAYRGLDYKNGPVIEAMGNVIVMVLSFFFFAEKIDRRKFLGMCLIVTGFIVFHMS